MDIRNDFIMFSLSVLTFKSICILKKSTKTCQDVTYCENSYSNLIGNTPIIELKSISKILKRKIYAKMESMNPGFSRLSLYFPPIY